MTGVGGVTVVLASRFAESTTGDAGPGLTAFLIVMALAGATALLLWSMVRQLRKVPRDLDVPLRPGSSTDGRDARDPGSVLESDEGDGSPAGSADQ
jgi:hypothetical protein